MSPNHGNVPPQFTETASTSRRNFLRLAVGAGAAVALAACTHDRSATFNAPPSGQAAASAGPSASEGVGSKERALDEAFLGQVADSLLAQGEPSHGGLRFRSEIQPGHYQTDQDVGAASVGRGFLAMAAKYPDDPKWNGAAVKAADWLLAVGKKDNQGRSYWPDFVNDNETSSSLYASYDDGTLGVGDYLYEVFEATGDEKYKEAALSSLEWTFAHAELSARNGQEAFRWKWNIHGKSDDEESNYKTGMGMGEVGMVHTFATYYERLKESDPQLAAKCKRYIDGTLRHLDNVKRALGGSDGDARALPESSVKGEAGGTAMNSGYLSGAAGEAFMNLKLYRVFGDKKYLEQANKTFSWLENSETGPLVHVGEDAVAWKLAIDPQRGDDDALANGFEEGSAGIGWVYTQAYKITGNTHYLDMAKKAANGLDAVKIEKDGQYSWREAQNSDSDYVHANLNNGAAGIGMFLEDLAQAGGGDKYHQMAGGALKFLQASAKKDANGNVYWTDNGGEADYNNDPSWHWGKAGIIAFMARMTGGTYDVAGEQPALQKRQARNHFKVY
ncbi:MAG TPA: lanthionine synthetase LanC family protein [Candidatus Saccharimonadales bacterium]|nr:lanthionine synthetase LanC family protein [Candidatus Saccharimonadales bacterium]